MAGLGPGAPAPFTSASDGPASGPLAPCPGKGRLFFGPCPFSQASSLPPTPVVPGPHSCLHTPALPTSEPVSPDGFSLWGLPEQSLPGLPSLDVASCPPPVPPASFLDHMAPFALADRSACSRRTSVSVSIRNATSAGGDSVRAQGRPRSVPGATWDARCGGPADPSPLPGFSSSAPGAGGQGVGCNRPERRPVGIPVGIQCPQGRRRPGGSPAPSGHAIPGPLCPLAAPPGDCSTSLRNKGLRDSHD